MDASLARAAKQAEAAGVALSMQVYITSVDAGKDIEQGSLSSTEDVDDAQAGRPDLSSIVQTACAA